MQAMSSSTPGRDVVVEPVAGWRVWRLTSVDGEVRLAAVARGSVWPPLRPMGASCPQHAEGEVPGADCMCGLYAASTLRALARAGVLANRHVGVVGSIEMWGRVVEHDRGTRSALAYPSRLRLVCGPCMAERRGPVTPVEVLARGADLAPVCARHLGPGERGRPAAEVEQELLGVYAVEVLPAQTAVAGLRPRRGAAAILRLLDALPRIPERFRSAARAAVAVVTVLALAVALSTSRGPEARRPPPALASGGGSSRVESNRGGTGLAPSVPQQHQLPILCGVVGGGVIQRTACRAGHADAVGFPSSPAAPPSSCDGETEVYTRGGGRSVCWLVVAWKLDELDAR
jgi:hypothetical protein